MAQGGRAVGETTVSEAGGAEATLSPLSPVTLTIVPEALQAGLHYKKCATESNIPTHDPSPVRFPYRPRT